MPALCSIITWLLVLAVLIGIGYALAFIVSLVVPSRWEPPGWLVVGGVPALVVLALVVLYFRSQKPELIFKEEFGFDPTPDVVIENSEAFALGDSGDAHLLFKCSPATFAKISAKMRQDTRSFGTNGRPSWWKTPTGSEIVNLKSETPRNGFSSGYVQIWYDPANQRVWYESVGVD